METTIEIGGVTGPELRLVLTRALQDYTRGDNVKLPSDDECERWVLSRTSPRNGGPFCCRWTLATREQTERAPRKCPALAGAHYTFWASRRYHPSLKDLTTICQLIIVGSP